MATDDPYDPDAELIEMLAGELATETGHMWRHSDSHRLRALVRHDERMPGRACLTCMLLDLVAARLAPPQAARPVEDVHLPDPAPRQAAA